MAMEPDTTDVMKNAAPMSSPIARLPEPTLIAANVEKRSGEPLPNARKVTPAIDSDIRRVWDRVAKLGQKKSLAAMPIALNNKHSQIIYVNDGLQGYLYHDAECKWSNIAKRTEIEFEIVNHANFTLFTPFQHESALIGMRINILTLSSTQVRRDATFFFAKGEIESNPPLNVVDCIAAGRIHDDTTFSVCNVTKVIPSKSTSANTTCALCRRLL
jgi:hypothetical protein